MSFENLGLEAGLLRALSDQGYENPTAIQATAIPVALAGGDLMAAAQTGTGKTAAFALPLLQRLMQPRSSPPRAVRALVLVPTRELAAQVAESVRIYGRHMPLRSAQVFGGVSIVPQLKALRAGVDVLVATPGRLLDHLSQRSVDLSHLEILVLDEADRMLDMGFLPDVERIIERLPKARQTLLFSATFPDPIRALARRFQREPAVIEVARRNAPSHTVDQRAYWVDQERKRELLAHLIWDQRLKQVLVFTRTKHGADRLAKHLLREQLETAVIHGDKTQGARTRALDDFKRQAVRVLVATDIAARGLDIDELPHVVNFELPHVPEDYVHRIGRTGRAGREGTAISLICHEERARFEAIRRLVKVDIPATTVAGFEPSAATRSAQHAAERSAQPNATRPAQGAQPQQKHKPAWRRPNPRARRRAASW